MMNDLIEKRVEELLGRLSLKEKIGQVTQIYYVSKDHDQTAQMVRDIQPGSVILCDSAFAGNEYQKPLDREKLDELQRIALHETDSGIPVLFGRDVIHGHRVVLPIPLTMASSFNPELVQECYDAVREEAVYDGVKWTFAPMLDMSHDPRWGRIIESPGEDPYMGEWMAKAVVNGFQTDDLSNEQAIAACAKHFVGYGASEGGRDYNHTEIGDYLLKNSYLPAFRSAVEAGVATVMSSFNDVNGIPVSGSRYLLTDVLRGEMGFEGFVVSDWYAIHQMMQYQGFAADDKHAAQLSLNAGIDMDMADNCYLNHLEELVQEGTVTMDELDEAVRRILRVKVRMGLLEHPLSTQIPYDEQAHCVLAKQLAQESMVLLKNKNNVLPLSKTATVGMAGPYLYETVELVGSWALDTDASLICSPAEAMRRTAPEAQFVENPGNLADEITMLRDADAIVLFLGESRRVTGEAHSLASVELPESQLAIVRQAHRTGKPVVGVLCFGRPIALGEADELFDAIVYAGHGGTCAGPAIASVLFGDAEPSGRLAFTLPYSTGQIPLYYNAYPGSRQINGYYRDEFIYHRNYQDCTGAPAYPFGYGLSYTTFTYTDAAVDVSQRSLQQLKDGEGFTVTCKVTNTGTRQGSTVVQLYVRDVLASRLRPLRSLRGFQKVDLQAGESKTVSLTLGYKDLGFYLENGDYTVEAGDFTLYVGDNCLTENEINIAVNEAR